MWPTFALLGIIIPVVICNPIDTLHRRQNTSVTLITGVQTRTPDGNYYTRREIRDIQANSPDLWNLYLLGLRSFHAVDQRNPLSYYQIAGIHGMPFTVWQNAEGIPGKQAGYCPHNSIIFLSWHRPCIMVSLTRKQQELYKHIQNIAAQFPPSLVSRYTAAAKEFRAPYWDWALGKKGGQVPELIVSPTTQVTDVDGIKKTIPNPLASYQFHPLIPEDFSREYTTWNSTLRHPNSKLPDAVSQINLVHESFNMWRRSYMDKVHNAFTMTSMNANMTIFSNQIEIVHGGIHWTFATVDDQHKPVGHMWPSEYSAFDPVFMLHHSNVDRLLSLYQGMFPDRYFLPGTAGGSESMWFNKGDPLSADTPLKPFWRTPTAFWTSTDAKDTKVLGYVYPETQDWKFENYTEYNRSVSKSVVRLYSGSTRDRLVGNENDIGEGEAASLQHVLVDNRYTDWEIKIQVPASSISGSFVMSFYLDSVVNGGVGGQREEGEVGAWILVMAAMDSDASEVETNGLDQVTKSTSTVSLTASLLDEVAAGRLASLEEEDVVPLLKERLSWRMRAGAEYFPTDKDLTIQVLSTHVRIPEDPGEFLQYSDDWTLHPEVVVRRKMTLLG